MDGRNSISPQALYDVIATAAAPIVHDACRNAAFDANEHMPVSARRRDPDEVGKP